MSSRQSLILALIILVVAGGFFWWRGQAEQQIERQVDLFIETVEYRKLSLTRPETRSVACRDLFQSVVEVETPSPAPSGKFGLEEVIEELHRFHSYISFFEIVERKRKILRDGDRAVAKISGDFQVASGPNGRYDSQGTLELVFEKEEDWRISAIRFLTD